MSIPSIVFLTVMFLIALLTSVIVTPPAVLGAIRNKIRNRWRKLKRWHRKNTLRQKLVDLAGMMSR